MAFANRIDIFGPGNYTPNGITNGIISGKVQLASTFANLAINVDLYTIGDTAYSHSYQTLSVTTDANGDASFSMQLAQQDSISGAFLLRVTNPSGSPALTPINSAIINLGAIGTLSGFLQSLLDAFFSLERFEEPGMPNIGYDTWKFGWGNWTSDSPFLAGLDEGDITLGSTYKVDFANGQIFYITPPLSGHDVRATYKFNLFTTNDIYAAFQRALATVNGWKPQTGFSLDSMPSQWNDILVLGAYQKLLEQLSLKIHMFKFRRLFEDAAGITAQINSRLTEARQEFKEMLPKIKRRGYAQPLAVTNLTVGGLSFQADSTNFRTFVISR